MAPTSLAKALTFAEAMDGVEEGMAHPHEPLLVLVPNPGALRAKSAAQANVPRIVPRPAKPLGPLGDQQQSDGGMEPQLVAERTAAAEASPGAVSSDLSEPEVEEAMGVETTTRLKVRARSQRARKPTRRFEDEEYSFSDHEYSDAEAAEEMDQSYDPHEDEDVVEAGAQRGRGGGAVATQPVKARKPKAQAKGKGKNATMGKKKKGEW
jgi:hypothetical protein